MAKRWSNLTLAFGLALWSGGAACTDDGDDPSPGSSDAASTEGAGSAADDPREGSEAGQQPASDAARSDGRVPQGRDAAPADGAAPTEDAAAHVPPKMDAGGAPGADAMVDSGVDSGADAVVDASEPGAIVAVPDTRCALAERVGLVEVSYSGSNPYLSARIYDRANPWYGAPELTSASCAFHRFDPSGACGACAGDELCGIGGQCVKAPRLRRDVTLELRAGTQTQQFTASDLGELYGEVTLGASALAATLVVGEHTVSLVETPLASTFSNPYGLLTGGYDQPDALDLTWTAPAVGSVYTLIPINHHAAGPTFTECLVPASAGALHVDGNMLRPLSVRTGLEFQELEHGYFAAAETPAGCIELRFTRGLHVTLHTQ